MRKLKMMEAKQLKRARNVKYSRVFGTLRISAQGYIPTNGRKISVGRVGLGGWRGSRRPSTRPKLLFQRTCNFFSKIASYYSIRRPRWDGVIGPVTGLWAGRFGVRMMTVKEIVPYAVRPNRR